MKKILTATSLLLFFSLANKFLFAQCTPAGDPNVFGSNVWNVYAWNAGEASDTGTSWNTNYSGYYVDTNLNLNSESRWNADGSPSDASGYSGCPVDSDNHSWSAKRTGFPSGYYNIGIPSHDDEAQLYVNGTKVWEHIGCCDSHGNVWSGFLCSNSSIEFRVTEGGGSSYGSIRFFATTNPILASGTVLNCFTSNISLSSSLTGTYLWSTGQTTSSISLSTVGTYSLTVTDAGGCSVSGSINIVSQSSPTATIAGSICLGAGNLTGSLTGNPCKVEWQLNGSTVSTQTATWSSGVTVAGGNGAGNAPNQLNYPRGICFDLSDNMYVVDFNNYRVQKFAPGSTYGVTVAGGNGQGSTADKLYQPLDVAVDASGNVYVSDYGRVMKWAPGAATGVAVASSSYPDYYFGTCWIALDAQNNIYVSDYDGARILKFTPGNSTPVVVAGGNGNGSAANQLSYPYDIYVDGNSNLYVCDHGNSRIQKWAPGATEGTTFLGDGSYYDSPTAVSNPDWITMDAAGNTYIVTENSQVRFFSAGSTSCTEIANYYSGAAWPEGIALSANHDLYVVNGFQSHLVKKYPLNDFSSTTYTPTVEGVYSINVSSFDGCPGIPSSSHNVYKSPVISDGNLFAICDGSSITLHATNTSGYVWNPGNVSVETATFSPTSTTTYTVSDLHNCSVTAQVVVPDVVNVLVTGSACTGSVLTANLSSIPSKLEWKQNGNTVHTEGATWNATATTVAGGNGPGNAANQFGSGFYSGIFVDPAGNLYVCDNSNDRVQKFAPGATNGITVAGGNGGGSAANQLDNPDGIFVDVSGNMYIAEAYNNRISKWTPGSTSGITVAGGNGFGGDLNQLKYPISVSVDAAGNVYVLDGWDNARVMKWAPGATQGVVVAGGNGQGSADNQINRGTGMVMDNTGNIYVADWYANRVQKWAPGATTGVTIMSGLYSPNGLWRDGAGYFYVVNSPYVSPYYESHIVRFKEGDIQWEDIIPASYGSAANQLGGASNGCFDVNGNMYVLDGSNYRIQKFTAASINQTFTPYSTGDYTAVATSSGGCSSTSAIVSVFQSPHISTTTLSTCSGSSITLSLSNSGSFTWNPGNLSGSSVSVSPTSTTTYTVTDNGNSCSSTAQVNVSPLISATVSGATCLGSGNLTATLGATPYKLEWKLNGNTANTVSASYTTSNAVVVAGGNGAGSGANQLYYPYGMCVDAAGNVYVAEISSNRVTKWAPGATQGTVVAGGNGYGFSPNQLSSPIGVYFDGQGNVYVADAGNNRIMKWAPGASAGVVVAGGNGQGNGLNQLNYPNALFVDGGGNIFISDASNSRIVEWTPGATQGIVVAGGNGSGPNANQFNGATDVLVDATGNIYVCDYSNQRVQKWAPGATSGVTVAGGNGFGGATNQLNNPAGIALDGLGNLYIVNAYYGWIVKWAPGATDWTFVAAGCCSGTGAINYARSIRIDGSGNIYATDVNGCRINKYTPNAITSSTFTPTVVGDYTVTTTSFAGCVSTSNIVTVYNYPTVSLTGNQYFCNGSSTILDAGSHQQYSWSTGGSSETETFDTAGNYSVTATDNGCATTKNFYVAAQTPVLNVSATPSTICTGNTSQLNAALTSGGLQYYVKTYYIDGNHLNGMPYSCSADARYGYYYQGQTGFYFADSGIGMATAIKVEFNIGAQYNANLSRSIWINNNYSGNGNFTAPYDNNCGVNSANFISMDLNSTNGYVVGGTNTINLSNSYYLGLVPTSSLNNYYARVTVQYQKPIVTYAWSPSGDTIANPVVTPSATTTYTLTANSLGCTNNYNVTLTVGPAPGDTSVFGDHVWNVYAFNAGGGTDIGHSWKEAYSGYYVDTNFNFNSQASWNSFSSPSGASGYNGCVVNNDNHSWFAKRRGFPCGVYQIDVPTHDDQAQLWVNGSKVWDQGCCNSQTNVWTGFLDDNSTVEFKVTEGGGASNGSINLILQNSISVNGPTTICPGYSLELTANNADSYAWSTGETTQSITVNETGIYSVTTTTNSCSHITSKSITVQPIDTAVISSYTSPDFSFCPSMFSIDLYTNYNPNVSYSWNTGDTYNSVNVSSAGTYSLTISDALGCSATSHVTVHSDVAGTDSAFGSNVWKVNAYSQGFYTGYYYYYTSGRAWYPDDYSGYYLDSTLNFNSTNKWNSNSNPSTAPGYLGCSIYDDNVSWSANRRGFPCGVYQIDVTSHDDDADLYVNGVQVWSHYGGCCDSHTNVWTGALNASSTVEFRVNEMYGGDLGSLQFTLVNSTSTFINVTGHPLVCTGQSYMLTSALLGTYQWSNGETTNPIYASSSGSYSVTVTDGTGCILTSDPVSVTILPDAAPVANITASSNSICDWNPVTLSSDSTSGNSWSTSETTQSISFTNEGDYTLTVTNGAGCYDTASIQIAKGYTPLAPSASNNGPVCQNSSVNLVASGLAPAGKAAAFNGINQYIKVNQNIPDSNFTIEMWVKTNAANGGIFTVTDDSSGGYDRNLYLSNGQLWVRVYASNEWNTGFTINDGNWHHIALVVQTGVGQTVYVDGISSGVGSVYDHSAFTWQTSFRMGYSADAYYYAQYFSGEIDNLRIWSEARSQLDIRNNMLLESPVSTTNLVYEAALNGNTNAVIGNNAAFSNCTFDDPLYFTYTWTGTGAPSPSTNETQTVASISSSGSYSVTASLASCGASPDASTSVTVTPLISYYPDADGDGYGSSTASPISSCSFPGAGYVTDHTDCNDTSASINPGATETCNSVDDNCNGQIDEGVTTTFYRDADGDGYGNAAISTVACTAPSGYVSNSTDCSDGNASVNPGATEVCNNIDDNCNGQIDEGVKNTYYADADHDGYGNPNVSVQACSAPNGYVSNNTDCNDSKMSIHPGATETCNNVDDNCNGQIDEGVKNTYYADADHDGYGNPNSFVQACSKPSGYVTNNTDCDDTKSSVHPGVTDICNGIDDNCNGQIDENGITATITPSGTVSFCDGSSITLTANSGSGLSYQWMKNSVNITGATKKTYTANASGNYQVKETNSYSCSATSSATVLNKVNYPSATITPLGNLNICQTGSVVLQANTGIGLTYNWLKGGVIISGATASSYTATSKGVYQVIVTNSTGCSTTSSNVKVTKSCRELGTVDDLAEGTLTIYPNPSTGKFMIDLSLAEQANEEVTIQVYNSIGQLLQLEKTTSVDGKVNEEIHLALGTPAGLYLIRIYAGNELYSSQLVVQK